jgi:RecA/RadA recombinase
MEQRNPEIELAEKYVNETGVSLFLTGKAGTGKTTFLHHIVANCPKRNIVLAPTGVAAVSAGGVTIHSFFQLPFCPYLPDVKELVTEYQLPESQKQLRKSKVDVIRTLDLLIIDEISMVRADLLDAVDAVMRRYRRSSRPFGGVQLLMIGDVQQLAPVVTDEERPYMDRVYPSPFFFHSKALQRLQYITIQLTTVYRQQDPLFLRLLNNIRDSKFDEATLAALNSRVRKPGSPAVFADGQEPILLTTHNWQADEVNRRNLEALDTPVHIFDAVVEGNFPDSAAPTERHLELKVGAQVMFVKNDSSGHCYYNGMIGVVDSVETDDTSDGQKHIVVVNSEGERIDVGQERWDTWKYEIDSTDNQIKPILDGVFVQYPLKTAWAVTIHKAQGLTFDRLQVDAAAAFTYGQVYVALSRCRSLEGLTLLSPITPQNAFENKDIEQFNSTMTPSVQVEQMLEGFRTQYYFDVLFELFDFSGFQHAVERMYRLYQDSLYRIYPDQTAELAQLCGNEVNGLMTVAERFRRQLAGIGMNPDSRSLLEERIGKAVVYFGKTLKSMDEKVSPLLTVEIDNKETVKHLKDIADGYRNVVGLKMALLSHVEHDGFSIEKYQKAKVDFTLQKPEKERRRKEQVVSESVQNPKLAAMLSAWRKGKADEMNVPAFAIMHQKTLFAIVNALPTTKAELLKVPGIGKGKVDKFGDEIVQMVRDYCTDNGIEVAPTLDEPLSTAEKSSSASKPEKTAMWRRTAELLAEGMSVASIAEELHRAVSTIEGYVFLAVENGALDPDLVVSQEAQDEIIAFLLDNRDMTHLKEVYEYFEGRYSYLQLRVARHLAAEL